MSTYTILIACFVVFGALFFLFKKKKVEARRVAKPHPFHGAHDCGIRALLAVMPDIKHEDLRSTFLHCSDDWPHSGISDKDFNVGLRHLGLYDLFSYDSSKDTIGNLKANKAHTYIALIGGHYTVIERGKIVDANYSNMPSNTQVFGKWKLL